LNTFSRLEMSNPGRTPPARVSFSLNFSSRRIIEAWVCRFPSRVMFPIIMKVELSAGSAAELRAGRKSGMQINQKKADREPGRDRNDAAIGQIFR
jgi:hypothetical protein